MDVIEHCDKLLPKIQSPWILSSPLCCNKRISRTSTICKEGFMILTQSIPYIAKSWSAGLWPIGKSLIILFANTRHKISVSLIVVERIDPERTCIFYLAHPITISSECMTLSVYSSMVEHAIACRWQMKRLMRLTQHWLWASNSIHTFYTRIYTRLKSRSDESYVVLSTDRWHSTGWQYRQYLIRFREPACPGFV